MYPSTTVSSTRVSWIRIVSSSPGGNSCVTTCSTCFELRSIGRMLASSAAESTVVSG